MNEQWIEIFRTGTHTAMNGESRTWTTDDLDEIVRKYNESEHEAPVVIGHPKDNSPAYGWVQELRRSGEVLEALLKDVDPAFSDAVQNGNWKKRSISLYPDLTLRHIGFLGGMPPAVKGLKDVSFATSGEVVTIDFATTNTKEYLKMDSKLEEGLRDQIAQRDKQIADFGEQHNALKTQLDTVASQLETVTGQLQSERQSRRENTLENFCDGLIGDGHIVPAQKEPVLDMMRVLDDENISFGEGDDQKSGVDALVALLKTMPKQIHFSEHATHKNVMRTTQGKAQNYGENVDAERMAVHEKAMALKVEKNISYSEAVTQIIQGE